VVIKVNSSSLSTGIYILIYCYRRLRRASLAASTAAVAKNTSTAASIISEMAMPLFRFLYLLTLSGMNAVDVVSRRPFGRKLTSSSAI
jgi:hypothetical protein